MKVLYFRHSDTVSECDQGSAQVRRTISSHTSLRNKQEVWFYRKSVKVIRKYYNKNIIQKHGRTPDFKTTSTSKKKGSKRSDDDVIMMEGKNRYGVQNRKRTIKMSDPKARVQKNTKCVL